MLNEIKNSAAGTFKDRVYSPLPGSFIIAWLITNWELVLFTLTTKKTSLETINYIKNNYLDLRHVAYEPLIATAIFIIIYPWLSAYVTILWQKAYFYKKIILSKMEAETPLTLEQSNNIRSQLSDKNMDIEQFQEQVLQLEGKLKRYVRLITFMSKRQNTDLKSFMDSIENTDDFKIQIEQEAYSRSQDVLNKNA